MGEKRERREARAGIRHGIDIERASTTCLAVQWGVAKLCLFHAVALCDALSSRSLRHRHCTVISCPARCKTPHPGKHDVCTKSVDNRLTQNY